MKTLNLAYPDKSDIKFVISKFPDGQQNITINDDKFLSYSREGSVKILSRLNNWLDLELIVCATKCLRELNVPGIHLYTPYILGSRSDRKFIDGGNNYLKDVICPIINSLGFETVTCIDPHSHSLECCIKNFKSIDNSELVKFALQDILK